MNKSIERKIYLNKLVSKMWNGRIKVITGIRRSGKSYLLFELFYDYLIKKGVPDKNIIRLSLDDADNERYLDPNELSRYLSEKTGDGKSGSRYQSEDRGHCRGCGEHRGGTTENIVPSQGGSVHSRYRRGDRRRGV